MAIGVGTARLISGRLVDHGKIHVVSIVSLVSLAISFSVFATVHTSFVFFACALAIGIGFGVSVPAFQCLFVNVAQHHMRGYPYESGYRLRSRGGLLPSFLIRLYPLGKSLVREE